MPLKTLNLLNRWTSTLFLLLITIQAHGQSFPASDVYKVVKGDSLLTTKFVKAVCDAARNHSKNVPGRPSNLEQLILIAADAAFNQPETPAKVYQWHSKFGSQLYCEASDQYPAGDFIRQVVYSNYRYFANNIGPNNRLPLNLNQQDPADSLDLFEFVNEHRKSIEARHHDKRFEFQQDEDWRNIMFFYFLFSEYKINYGPE